MAMSMPSKAWTLEELHRLPDDGNKYEVIRGELFVTPPPSIDHEEVLSPTTRRRDLVASREYYLDAGAGEYWVVDGERREIRVIRRGAEDVVARDSVV